MSLALYSHPFSAYCQKVLVALYENGTAFEYRTLEEKAFQEELHAIWPFKLFPVLTDGPRPVRESSIIIEYLQQQHPGPVRLIPQDPEAALEVRFMDRVFDNYVQTPMSSIVFNSLRPEDKRDPFGVERCRAQLDTAYSWLNEVMAARRWAAGAEFSMADCAAAPSLFYADWVHPFGDRFPHLRTYRERLLARPSFARAVDEARPFRHYFPLGAPDRD
ncbi:glutathione S-transferase family protein [Roseococcus sp. YIM B11640]|uniref:glutathione S-transferase family protein n=1 Tax=Roseococcus sp. YIM B11640 TaxID=3133973 RepID=UPI003C7D3F59